MSSSSSAASVWGSLTVAVLAYFVYLKRQQQRTNTTAAAAAAAGASSAATPAPASSASAASAAPAAKKASAREKSAASRSSKKLASQKLKMVLCVRSDLGMGKGKMMAQCCHAAVGVVRELLETEPALVDSWENNGAMKIALKVSSEDELVALEALATAQGLGNYLVYDAGHTQIAPDSKTVLAIGPAPAKVIDQLTGHLKLM